MELTALFLVDEVEIPSVAPLDFVVFAKINAVGVRYGNESILVPVVEHLDSVGSVAAAG